MPLHLQRHTVGVPENVNSQFEARSAHSGVLHSAPCGAGRLEFSVWHVFCTLSGEVVWVDEPNILYSYRLFDVM